MSHGSKITVNLDRSGLELLPVVFIPGRNGQDVWATFKSPSRKLTIVRVDTEQNLLLIKGAVPGKPGALVNVVPEKKVGW